MAPGSRVALVAFGLVAIAVGWFLVRPTVGPIRHDSPGAQESRSPPPAGRPESSPPSSSDSRTETRTETRPAVAPAAPPLNAVPAGASPEVLRSYLSGRSPDETRPDGTQIFHNMPFEVRQPDGSFRVVPVTITLQPTAPKPVMDEGEPPKAGRKGN